MLCLRPAFCSRDMITYLVLSAFTSSAVSLLATTKAPAFFFIVCPLPFESSLFYSLGACTFRTMISHQRPLRTIYDILSLTNSTLLTASTNLWCTNILFPIDDFRFLVHTKNYNPLLLSCPLCPNLTSCTSTKSDLYLANSLAAAVSETALYRLLTFHVPNLMFVFRCSGRTKLSVQVRGFFMNIS